MKKVLSLVLSVIIIITSVNCIDLLATASEYNETTEDFTEVSYTDMFYGYSSYLIEYNDVLRKYITDEIEKAGEEYSASDAFFSSLETALASTGDFSKMFYLITDSMGITSHMTSSAVDKAVLDILKNIYEDKNAEFWGKVTKSTSDSVKTLNETLDMLDDYHTILMNGDEYTDMEKLLDNTIEKVMYQTAKNNVSFKNVSSTSKTTIRTTFYQMYKNDMKTVNQLIKFAKVFSTVLFYQNVQVELIDYMLQFTNLDKDLIAGLKRVKSSLVTNYASLFLEKYTKSFFDKAIDKIGEFFLGELDPISSIVATMCNFSGWLLFDVMYEHADVEEVYSYYYLCKFVYAIQYEMNEKLKKFDNTCVTSLLVDDFEYFYKIYSAVYKSAKKYAEKISRKDIETKQEFFDEKTFVNYVIQKVEDIPWQNRTEKTKQYSYYIRSSEKVCIADEKPGNCEDYDYWIATFHHKLFGGLSAVSGSKVTILTEILEAPSINLPSGCKIMNDITLIATNDKISLSGNLPNVNYNIAAKKIYLYSCKIDANTVIKAEGELELREACKNYGNIICNAALSVIDDNPWGKYEFYNYGTITTKRLEIGAGQLIDGFLNNYGTIKAEITNQAHDGSFKNYSKIFVHDLGIHGMINYAFAEIHVTGDIFCSDSNSPGLFCSSRGSSYAYLYLEGTDKQSIFTPYSYGWFAVDLDYKIIINNPAGVDVGRKTTFRNLFNHKGNDFTYSEWLSCIDYDGDGLNDNEDPNPAGEHDLSFVSGVNATCLEKGYVIEHCNDCEKNIKSEIPAYGHEYNISIEKAATCTETGIYNHKCRYCDYSYQTEVPIIEHSFSVTKKIEPTCEDDGIEIKTCKNCGLEQTTVFEKLNNRPHDFNESIIAPTCTDDGYTLHQCSKCSYSYKDEYVESFGGHNFNLSNQIEVTCTSEGYNLYTCARCNLTEKRNIIPATGHKYVFTITVEPSCTAQGYDLYTCSSCNSTEKRNTVSSIGHQYTLSNHIDSTCNNAGYDEYKCTVCGDTYRNDITALDGSALAASLEKAQTYLAKDYFTNESMAVLQNVYDSHINDLDILTTQMAVDNAATEINTAINELVLGDSASGETDNGISWKWERNTGVLTVSGTGSMANYGSSTMPWYDVIMYTTEIVVSDGITSIGKYAFYKAKNVTQILLPNTLTKIGQRAFEYCTSVEEIVVPNTVVNCGYGAFANMTSLKKVTVPASTTYCSYCFDKDKAINEINITYGIDGVMPVANVTAEQMLLFTTKTGAFGPWKYVENAVVTIEDGVSKIGDKAFYYCSGIKCIEFPDTVQEIGTGNFMGADAATEITILNPECAIQDGSFTSSNTIRGYSNSTAEVFANNNSIPFKAIDEHIHTYGEWTYNGDAEYVSSINYKNGTQTRTCSVCGEEETVEAPNTALLSRRGNALALESSITLTTYINKDVVDYYDEVYAEFTRNGKTETIYASDKTFKSGSMVYNIFDYAGISPQAMGDDIEIKFYGFKDGIKYWGETYTYSVTTYVTSTLSKSTTSAKLKTMLIDLMYYGEACQIYQNYKTDSLMTNILTDEQKQLRSTGELNLTNIKDSSYATCENRLVRFGTALRLNNAVEIAIPLNMTNVTLEELAFRVKIGSRDLTYTYSDNPENFEKGKDGYWYFYFDGVYANQMSDEVFITAYRGDEQVSYTLKYSVESYAATVTDSKLKKVTDAMMRYGNSAKAYSGK